MYKVIVPFSDLQDNNHVYNVNDVYPRKGVKPSEERIEELASDKNKIGKPLIVVEDEPVKKEKKAEKKPKEAKGE